MTRATTGESAAAASPRGWRRLLPPPWRHPAPVVGVLRLSGIIGGVSPLRNGLSLATTAQAIEKVFALRHLKQVAIIVNSPGGSPVQSTLIYKRIRALAEEREVPVATFCEDVAASGGYLVALAGDEIFADESSIVGSIGVVSAGFGFDQAIGRLGIERRVHTAGPRKMILDPFQPEKAEDVETLKAVQEEIHETFKGLVRARRGAAIGLHGDALFSGEFWTGARAAELGLVDGVGDIRQVMRERFGKRVRLKPVPISRGWRWQQRGGVGEAAPIGLGGLGGRLADDLISALEERAAWGRYGL
jgi:signal peptide peptidase SppA